MLGLEEFIIAALALLLTPGPTNTLLATGGALYGARSAWSLVPAELLGYACAISALRLFVAPVTKIFDAVEIVLRLLCAAYLAFIAYTLWKSAPRAEENTITFLRVFGATLSNPKGMVFAFVVLPPGWAEAGFASYVIILMALIAFAGTCWVLAGAALRQATGLTAGTMVRRASSVVMASFSAMIIIATAASATTS